MLNDLTDGLLDEALKFATSIEDKTLSECLESVQLPQSKVAPYVTVEVFKGWAVQPHSFEFQRFINGKPDVYGGITFHGEHDGFGSGAYITSVCLTPTKGWQVHT